MKEEEETKEEILKETEASIGMRKIKGHVGVFPFRFQKRMDADGILNVVVFQIEATKKTSM